MSNYIHFISHQPHRNRNIKRRKDKVEVYCFKDFNEWFPYPSRRVTKSWWLVTCPTCKKIAFKVVDEVERPPKRVMSTKVEPLVIRRPTPVSRPSRIYIGKPFRGLDDYFENHWRPKAEQELVRKEWVRENYGR